MTSKQRPGLMVSCYFRAFVISWLNAAMEFIQRHLGRERNEELIKLARQTT